MASTTVQNRHFTIDGGTFTFFGISGMHMGESWAVNGLLGAIMVQVDPEPVCHEIEMIIEQDRAAGNEEKIDHVLINSRYALLLALEGKLTREILAKAQETEDSIIATMELGGKPRKVVIKQEGADGVPKCATIDAEGNIV